MAVSKGRETKKDILDLPLDIDKVGTNAKEGGGIISSTLPIKSKVDLSPYSLKYIGN